MILRAGVTVINFISELITGTPSKEKKEEDPEKEGDFPENCLFRLVHNYAHRMAAAGEGKDTRKSQEAISYANRRLTETEVFKEAPLEDGEEEVELGEGEKELSFPLSFIVFSGLFGWSPSPSFLPSRFGKDSFLQLLLREGAGHSQIDRCLRGSGIRRH